MRLATDVDEVFNGDGDDGRSAEDGGDDSDNQDEDEHEGEEDDDNENENKIERDSKTKDNSRVRKAQSRPLGHFYFTQAL